MSKLRRFIGWTVNALLVLLSVTLVGLYARDYLSKPEPRSMRGGIAPKVAEFLSDVEWESNETTGVLALSTTCVFCERSVEFHRRLATEVQESGRARLIAVFPQDPDEAREYLSRFNISINDVRKASFPSVGIPGTPALYLVDKTGKVTHEWMGKLSESGESEVFMKFFGVDPHKIRELEPMALKGELDSSNDKFLLDVRTRMAYGQKHIQGAINIPLDELPVRALDELPQSAMIFVYSDCLQCGNSDLGYRAILRLGELGFHQTAVLKGGLDAWKEAHLATSP